MKQRPPAPPDLVRLARHTPGPRTALVAACVTLAVPSLAGAQSSASRAIGFAPPPAPPRETPSAPPSWTVAPLTRLAVGIDGRFAGGPSTGGPFFALDVAAGAHVLTPTRAPTFELSPEVGYAHTSGGTSGTHLFTAGSGLGVRAGLVGIAWIPRFVVGMTDDRLAIGVRVGVAVQLMSGLFQFEAGYQYLHVEDGDRHDLRVQLGVDLGLLVYAVASHRTDLIPP